MSKLTNKPIVNKCTAKGCPLKGNVENEAGWWCFFHVNLYVPEHEALTRKIIENKKYFELGVELFTMSPLDFYINKEKFDSLNDGFKFQGESFFNYKLKFNKMLDAIE